MKPSTQSLFSEDERRIVRYLIGLDRPGVAAFEEYKRRNFDQEYLYKQYAWFHEQKLYDNKRGVEREATVDIDTFICSPFYMNSPKSVWPLVMTELMELNCTDKYQEAILTGAIGSAKTTMSVWTLCYQLYALSCFKDPHELFGLDPKDEIVIVFQSLTLDKAKEVGFDRLKARVADSPYFRETKFTFDSNILSKLVFPKRIIVKPISGSEGGAIGENVISGLIDEVNFMQVVENSKQTMDGGTFDQAVALYNSIARRRESRFMKIGVLPGMLCIASSKRYPSEFTEKKIKEARDLGDRSRIFVYDKRVWDVKPHEGVYSGERFPLFCGDQTRVPRIMTPAEAAVVPVVDKELVMEVPVEHRHQFEMDITGALRDIAGVSTLALHPFMLNRDAVAACFGKKLSVVSRDSADFVETKLMMYPERWKGTEQWPRFAHIDLAKTRDSAGLAIGYCPGFKKIRRGQEYEEIMPVVAFDLILEVRPPRNEEINYGKIRSLLVKMTELGCPLQWVTMDSYQSVDMAQILGGFGYTVGYESTDIHTLPYDVLKGALYDGRVIAPKHDRAQSECLRLEYDAKKGRIDHPAHGSKDCSDSMACVVFGLTMQTHTWAQHEIPLHLVPKYLTEFAQTKVSGQKMDGLLKE